MSTTNFSNFITGNLLADLSNVDLISSVSDQVFLFPNPSITPAVTARYFCIGDLLIQFSTNDITGIIDNQNTGSYQLDFPISYDATPYTIMLTGTRKDDNNQVIATLQSFDTLGFTFSISSSSNSGGWVNFIAIGPRPSSLYTS